MSNYIDEVADQLLSHCREMTFLSAADYMIIAEWKKEEIPIAVIFDSIKEVCENPNVENPQIASISHVQAAVKRKFGNWLQTQPG